MSCFSTLPLAIQGEAYGDARPIEVTLSVCADTGEVRLDLYDAGGSVRDVVLLRDDAIALAETILAVTDG